MRAFSLIMATVVFGGCGTSSMSPDEPGSVGRFVATAGQALFVSPDGEHWERSIAAADLRAVAAGNGLFVAVSPNATLVSNDGLSWEEEAGLDARAGPTAATAYLGQAVFQGTAPASAPFNMAANGAAADRKAQPATAPAPQSGLDFA